MCNVSNVKSGAILSHISWGFGLPAPRHVIAIKPPYSSRYPGNPNDIGQAPGPSRYDNAVNHTVHHLFSAASIGRGGIDSSGGCLDCHSPSNPFSDPYHSEHGDYGSTENGFGFDSNGYVDGMGP